MPEKICFSQLLDTDIDHIVPSLETLEFDENRFIHVMEDHDFTKPDNTSLHCMQDAMLCELLPMSPAVGMQGGNTCFPKFRSNSIGGDLGAELHSLCSIDEPQHTPFLQDLIQTGAGTNINGTIPIYKPSLNSSDLSNTPTTITDPSACKAFHTPQPQGNNTDDLNSLLFTFPDDLINIDCTYNLPSAFNGFPSQAMTSSTGNPVIVDDYVTIANNTANTTAFDIPTIPRINNPTVNGYTFNNSSPGQQLTRLSSWPHIDYKEDIEEPVNFNTQHYGQVCRVMNDPMDRQQASTLPRQSSGKPFKSHRRASSESNITMVPHDNQMIYGAHNAQLLSNETLTFVKQKQQQHLSHPTNTSINKIRRPKSKNVRHPYTHFPHNSHTTNTGNSSHTVMNNGIHNTSNFSPLPYPTSTATFTTSSPGVIHGHSQSVPNSPSIQRASESMSTQQQYSGGPCSMGPVPGTASNFTFDPALASATPTHISPCDFNAGTSQEARDEKEKAEAFSRLHQGLHLWEFLMEILLTNDYQPILKWTDKENGVFKIVDSEALARFWGEYRRKPKMNYDKMSRAIRYYYGKDILDKAPKRLFYQFKYHSHWWEKLQKVDPSFKINYIPASDIPAPSVQDLILPEDL